jgi:arylformamidase
MGKGNRPLSGHGWIDVSVPLRSGMVHWPGDPEVKIDRMLTIESGDDCNVSTIFMSSHTGTHIDSPYHFIKSGIAIHDLPLSAVIGKARVIEIADTESIKPEELRLHRVSKGERILFKTLNSKRCWKSDKFVEDFVYISTESLQYLVDRKVRTIGVDYLSVGGYNKNISQVHRALLKAGIWIIEGLDLSRVKKGDYELICLPMKIEKGDGAPARAVIRPYKC